ncbi:nitrate/nitrite sensor protein NarQ [Salmonella enterica subsp. enterica]|uniref:Nitrate/nitrite sensor protein NarQ n=1 Tax=Salmonella enterica I TaxID=59201 RepID=A0A379W6P7_SALET|nr:nitrate/nitrite sensor protein NarQ [Salmonella enterica subsp. enterica]
MKRAIPEDNAGAQSIMADFSRALNDAYRQLRELLTTFRLTLQQADLPSALHEMLEDLQSQTRPNSRWIAVYPRWRWMRKCRCIYCKLCVKRS